MESIFKGKNFSSGNIFSLLRVDPRRETKMREVVTFPESVSHRK